MGSRFSHLIPSDFIVGSLDVIADVNIRCVGMGTKGEDRTPLISRAKKEENGSMVQSF